MVRSQIFTAIVETENSNSSVAGMSIVPAPGSRVCVKVFDHDLVEVDDDERTLSPATFCSKAFSTEAVIYCRLEMLCGVEIPRLYLLTTLGPYHALILEHIDQLNLFDYTVESEQEMTLLEAQGLLAVGKLHLNGVYHGDIRASNILWSGSTQRFVILDFERALLFDGMDNELIETWKRLDFGELNGVLWECAVKGPRRVPPCP